MTSGSGQWVFAPEEISARAGEVHIWRAFLNDAKWRMGELQYILSEEELARAGRFRFQRDREDFIVSRAILRCLIARFIGTGANDVRFSYDIYGKPRLADERHRWLRFNLSHSNGLGLYAISADREIGIDIEYISERDIEFENIFSEREMSVLKQLPEKARRRAFYACWTRKEAYIKARGEGLSVPLKSFSVSLAPGEPAALLEASPAELCRWSLCEIEAHPQYAAAVAVEGRLSRVSCWQIGENDLFATKAD